MYGKVNSLQTKLNNANANFKGSDNINDTNHQSLKNLVTLSGHMASIITIQEESIDRLNKRVRNLESGLGAYLQTQNSR